MTQRKPAGMTWDSWIDGQVASARSSGEFTDLPGKGKPIPGLDEPYDELWWVKSKLAHEGLSAAPQTMATRYKVETWLEKYLALPSAFAVKQQATALNKEIASANRGDLGPYLPQKLLDVPELMRQWAAHRKE